RSVNRQPLSGEPAERQPGGGEVFERSADRFEQRDLVRALSSATGAANKTGQVAGDTVGRQRAGLQRLDDVAGLVQGRLGINKDAGAADGVVVALAHVRA